MEMLAWQPETFGPARENHIMRSSSVVRTVRYGKGRIAYSTFDALAPCEDVLRLAFAPTAVSADGKPLPLRQDTVAERLHDQAAAQRRLHLDDSPRRLPRHRGRGRRSARDARTRPAPV